MDVFVEEPVRAGQPVFRKTLRRADIVFLSISAVIGIDTIAQIAATGGAQAFTWALVIAVTFMLPYALIMAELGSTFHEEGGPYICSTRLRQARRRDRDAVLLGDQSDLDGRVARLHHSRDVEHIYLADSIRGVGDISVKFCFIWLAIATAVVGLRHGKRIVAAGAIAKVGLIIVFVVTVIIYAVQHGVHGYAVGGYTPTVAGFLAVTPVLLFAVVGFEAPNGAAEEMHNPKRDVPRAIASSGTVAVLCYLVPIFAILAVLPADKIHGASGFLDAVREVFTVYGPAAQPMVVVAAILFIFAVFTQASAWMIASDRVQAAAASEGAFPRYFGKFSPRLGTPVRMNVFSGVIATIFAIAATLLLQGSTAAVFTVVLTVAISTLLLSYLLIFPTALVLRRKRPETDRPYRVPGGAAGIWICAV